MTENVEPKKEEEIEGDSENDIPGYVVSKEVAVKDLLNMDQDDESLRKYKEALLPSSVFSPPNDPRRVVITKLTVICDGRPDGDIVYEFKKPEDISQFKERPFVLQEGCQFKIKVEFRVQHEIVSGLKYVNSVYRKGVRVARETTMLGSYPPQEEPHVVTFPRHEWSDAPKGLLARGDWNARSQFICDDKKEHLGYTYYFSIKKTW